MKESDSSAVNRVNSFVNKPFIVAFLTSFILFSCASKKTCTKGSFVGGAGMGLMGSVHPGSAQEFTLNVGDRVYFDTDSSSIRPDAVQTLSHQVQWLQQYRYNITVEGHSDERGTREYNLGLGARRAQAVSGYFVAHGISPSRINTISYGKEKPVAIGDDSVSWSKNRRAVSVLSGNG